MRKFWIVSAIFVLSVLGFAFMSNSHARTLFAIIMLASGIAAFYFFVKNNTWQKLIEKPGHHQ